MTTVVITAAIAAVVGLLIGFRRVLAAAVVFIIAMALFFLGVQIVESASGTANVLSGLIGLIQDLLGIIRAALT